MEDIKDDVVAFIEVCSGSSDYDLDKQERLLNLLYNEVREAARHNSDSDSDSHDDYTIRTNFEYDQKSEPCAGSVRQLFADLNSETIIILPWPLADAHGSIAAIPILPPTQDIEANDKLLTGRLLRCSTRIPSSQAVCDYFGHARKFGERALSLSEPL
jgi:hypothetical protein